MQTAFCELGNFNIYSDLCTVSLSLREPWKREIQIFNIERNETFVLHGEDVYPYVIVSHQFVCIFLLTLQRRRHHSPDRRLASPRGRHIRHRQLQRVQSEASSRGVLQIVEDLFLRSLPRRRRPPHRPQSLQRYQQSSYSTPEDYLDSMIWSDKMTDQSISISSFYFHLYDFSICGHALLGTFSTHYPAVLSTTSKCLSVPREVFDNLRGWLLLDCPANGTPGRDRLCYLGEVGNRGNLLRRRGKPRKSSRRSSFGCAQTAKSCESR